MSIDRHCVLSIDQVDALNWAAHRIKMYGSLVANILDDQWKQGDLVNEGFSELVVAMITDADAIQTITAAGGQTAKAETSGTAV